jgi:hypothetical protein
MVRRLLTTFKSNTRIETITQLFAHRVTAETIVGAKS